MVHARITDEQREALFEHEDLDADLWVGSPLSFFARVEMVPFKFIDARYVMIFEQAYDAAGGEQYFPEQAAELANGFAADKDCRIMKFLRTDSSLETAFDPDSWQLPGPTEYIYQFLGVLREAVEQHVRYVPDVKQYFYTPSTPKLQVCYNRVLRTLPATSNLNDFERIKVPLGKFYGFQRKKIGEPGNLAA